MFLLEFYFLVNTLYIHTYKLINLHIVFKISMHSLSAYIFQKNK